MEKKIVIFTLIIIAALSFGGQQLRAAFGLDDDLSNLDIKGPVVVELFTSQSCSSCPSADRVLSALSTHKNVIALGCHVTYWNHLHWEDTLSRPDCTNRQHAYANARNSPRVYTPQMVVNGAEEFVGSYRSTARKAVENAAPIAPIKLSLREGQLIADLPDLENRSYNLMIFATKDTHTQHVPSGENRGRDLTYHNSILLMESGGHWQGDADQKRYDLGDIGIYDGFVIIAQENGFGDIFAAGRLEL